MLCLHGQHHLGQSYYPCWADLHWTADSVGPEARLQIISPIQVCLINHNHSIYFITLYSPLRNNRMASSEPTASKYFACDVAAYSDAELDHFLEEHRLDGGAMVVEVEDPENLPQSFIQRLR